VNSFTEELAGKTLPRHSTCLSAVMASTPESDCMAYMKHKIGSSPFPDPECIRAMTQGMKREHWQKPLGAGIQDTVAAYLAEYGDLNGSELLRFGISPSQVGVACKKLGIRGERMASLHGAKGNSQTYYSVKGMA
jgi:hypothetical protein